MAMSLVGVVWEKGGKRIRIYIGYRAEEEFWAGNMTAKKKERDQDGMAYARKGKKMRTGGEERKKRQISSTAMEQERCDMPSPQQSKTLPALLRLLHRPARVPRPSTPRPLLDVVPDGNVGGN